MLKAAFRFLGKPSVISLLVTVGSIVIEELLTTEPDTPKKKQTKKTRKRSSRAHPM